MNFWDTRPSCAAVRPVQDKLLPAGSSRTLLCVAGFEVVLAGGRRLRCSRTYAAALTKAMQG